MNNYRESAEDPTPGPPADRPQPGSLKGPGFPVAAPEHREVVRAIVQIEGTVQGVGFRPFLYRLAAEHGLPGRVANSPSGVDLEVEGPRDAVDAFLAGMRSRYPPLATIAGVTCRFAEPVGHAQFVIADPETGGCRRALVSPDLAVCDDCLDELFDPSDRRFRYPLINCTGCGPRYTIISDVPYDRSATTMACFVMCAACQAEYDDPANRRFHAQPNACPQCGPRVWLAGTSPDATTEDPTGRPSAPSWNSASRPDSSPAIEQAARLLRQGAIVAVKGLGGFHLACDATNARAVETLRRRKRREAKPLALMVPDVETARRFCHLDAKAGRILGSRERPITLLPRRAATPVAEAVAPGNPYLGLMLPYTPLHYLLLFDERRRPRFDALVMTSGNRVDEPIAVGNREALQRLGQLADAFLLHDRDILVPADDSVLRYGSVREVKASSRPPAESVPTMIRRSRGYVPAPILLHRDLGEILAVGGHLKNTLAISRGRSVFLSQHIGDLENPQTLDFWVRSLDHLQRILGVRPEVVAHDLHPDYLSTRLARQLEAVQRVAVQHHHAHVAACMAEHRLDGPVIGVALDGTGYGNDGNVWGGEILIADYGQFHRAAHLRELPMPGNEQAIRQPWRMALSYLALAFGDDLWELPIPFVRNLDRAAAKLLLQAARRGVNSPVTSSCGRLFDAVAALVGLRHSVSYEGQAAMELEMAIDSDEPRHDAGLGAYTMTMVAEDAPAASWPNPSSAIPSCRPWVLDPVPAIRSVVADMEAQVAVPVISRRFHRALAQSLARAAGRIASETSLRRVVLGGGCFQNRFLQYELTAALQALELSVFAPRLVPPNDEGLALGQVMVASALRDRQGGP